MFANNNIPRPLRELRHPFKEGYPYAEMVAALLNNLQAQQAVSGPDSVGVSHSNTLDLAEPLGLRIMHWNLQDLGGGPSRGLERDDRVIRRIARIIHDCQPDVVVILEVKLLGRRPVMPEWTEIRKINLRDRENGGKTIDAQQLHERIQEEQEAVYQQKLARYEEQKKKYDEFNAQNRSTGIAELERIRAELTTLAGEPWSLVDYMGEHFTNGESYGFLVREELFSSSEAKLLSHLALGEGFRVPASLKLELRSGLHSTHTLDILAFHAPAPQHGEDTHDAMRLLAKVDYAEFVLCSDTNLSTEDENEQIREKAEDTMLEATPNFTFSNTEVELEFKAFFNGHVLVDTGLEQTWTDVPVKVKGWFLLEDWYLELDKACYGGDFKGQISRCDIQHGDVGNCVLHGEFKFAWCDEATENLMKLLAKNGGRVYWEPSMTSAKSYGATSLRKKVTSSREGRGKDGRYPDAWVFNFNAYDKAEYIAHKKESFVSVDQYIYPLYERCLPVGLHDEFSELEIDREDILAAIKAEQVEWGDVTNVQDALDAANLVSDHVPLVLDLAIVAGSLPEVDGMSGGESARDVEMEEVMDLDSADDEGDPEWKPELMRKRIKKMSKSDKSQDNQKGKGKRGGKKKK